MSISIIQAIQMSAKIYSYAKKNGFVEIITRNAKGQIDSITKCLLGKVSETAAQAVARTFSTQLVNSFAPGIGLVSQLAGNIQNELIRRAVKENGRMLRELSTQVSSLFSEVKVISGLSWLNTGLSLVNVGATVAGFMIMNSKLDGMSSKIDAIAKSLQDVKDLKIESDYVKPYKRLISDSVEFCYKVATKKEINQEKLETLIKDYSGYLDSTLRMGNKMDLVLLLQIVYDLLPVFSNLIVLYYDHFYYENDGISPLHNEWMNIFEQVADKPFTDRIMDFYYLNGLHNMEVNTIMDCNILLVTRLRTKIEDTVNLLEMSENAENYEEACAAINRYASEAAKDYKTDLANEYTEEEADDIIRQATEQALGTAF